MATAGIHNVFTCVWRKRVGVEPTIPSAKDGIAGFEGRGSHRTPFASGGSIAGRKSGDAERPRRHNGKARDWRSMLRGYKGFGVVACPGVHASGTPSLSVTFARVSH